MTQRKVLYIDPDKFQPKETSTQDELVGINTTPSGGTTGQVLKKNSDTNYDYSWQQTTKFYFQDGVSVSVGSPAVINHNLGLTNLNSYTISIKDSDNTEITARVVSVDTNSLRIESDSVVPETNMKVTIIGF